MEPKQKELETVHTIVKAQIVFLLSTLTEDNYGRHQHEIRSLSEQHGPDTYIHFLRRLVPHAHQGAIPPLAGSLLNDELQRIAADPALSNSFRDALDTDADLFRNLDLSSLPPLSRLILCATLVSSSRLCNPAATAIRADFDNAVIALAHGDHTPLSSHHLLAVISNLLVDPPPESPILDAAQRQALLVAARTKYGPEIMAPIFRAVLPIMKVPPNTNLVGFLVQLGPDITADPDIICAVLPRFSMDPPSNEQLVQVFSALGRLATEGQVLCDVSALVRAFCSYKQPLDWPRVIRGFDRHDRNTVDTPTLKVIIAVLLNTPLEQEHHAVAGFWATWSNSLLQLRVLDSLLSLPSDTFTFVTLPGNRIITVDQVANASPAIKTLAANVQSHTWNSLDLFEVLVRLSDDDQPGETKVVVREMLDKAVKISPEIVQMGLFLVDSPSWGHIRAEYSDRLLKAFLAGQPNHQLVFMRMWQTQPSYLTNSFTEFHRSNPLNITRILDVAQDLKILEPLLDVRSFVFALDLAALASRREYLNLDKWLSDKVSAHGSEFLHAILVFLDQKMEAEREARKADPPDNSGTPAESTTMPLNPTTITVILRLIRKHAHQLDETETEYHVEVRNACLQIHPRLMVLTPHGMTTEPGLSVVTYPPDVEAEIDSMYKQMYDEKTTMEQVLNLVHRLRESTIPRDHESFAYMLHSLFDEYKFFQACYPPRELAMTGFLLGSFIQDRLIEGPPLGIAMRYIVDALGCRTDQNLFVFGSEALRRFESRLPEWHPLCLRLLEMRNLLEYRPELHTVLQRALLTGGDAASDVNGILSVNGEPELPPVFTAIQPDDLDPEYDDPPEEDSDKILFIVNNLAPSNFDDKLEEMRNAFQDEYSRWFAQYLVDQRVASEPNNHGLYLRFLESLNRPVLDKYILHETYVKSASLLNNERSMQTGLEKNHLKNIAGWLGSITLAKEKPIKFKNLSFKDLLVEGYDSGRLIIAITFVCQALGGCAESKIFKPPNPWLMAVVALLRELYSFAQLKLNQKFEIELTYKLLDIPLDTIEPSTIIRNRPSLDPLGGPGLPDYPPDITALPMSDYGTNGGPPVIVDGTQQLISIGPSPASPAGTDAQRAVFGAQLEAIMGQLAHAVTVSSQLQGLAMNHTFKRAVQLGVDRAVREIIIPVVERSATISGISTHELTMKDFANDPSEDRLREAASNMAASLAKHLALVTCKEPLKGNLTTHIRNALLEAGYGEVARDEVVVLLAGDNWDVASNAIERAAMERAVADVDTSFEASFDARRHWAQMRTSPNQTFFDPSVAHSAFAISLPDPLRIRVTGVTQGQFNIYKDFVADDSRRAALRTPLGLTSTGTHSNYGTSAIPGPQLIAHDQAIDRFTQMSRDLDGIISQLPVQGLQALPANHDVRHLIRQILALAEQASDRGSTPLYMSQKTMQSLYRTTSQLGREAYVYILTHLCRAFDDVGKEAINWLLSSDDERKYNIPVTVTILQARLVTVEQQDVALAKLVAENPRPSLLDFSVGVVRACLTNEPPVAARAQFRYLIDILLQISNAEKATDEVNRLLDDLQLVVRRQAGPPAPEPAIVPLKPEQQELREKLHAWFQQWVALFRSSNDPEKGFVAFATQLSKQGVMKADESSSFFFRVCAETAVHSYFRCNQAGEHHIEFQSLDALARMIIYLVKYQGDPQGGNNPDSAKVLYLSKILSIFVLVLSSMHEELAGAGFQPKPIFRLFSTLMYDVQDAELGHLHVPLLISLCETLSSLQPGVFPGFAFHWLCLISHRLYMPKLLLTENREGWPAFHKLLCFHFQFMAQIMKDGQMTRAVTQLYRATLRVLMVLLHDFPDFLSEYYFSLSNALSSRCVQFRNIIACAFPAEMTLPDPYLGGQVFDPSFELGPVPPVLSEYASGLKSDGIRGHLDQILMNRGSTSILPSLLDRFILPEPSALGDNYNIPFINSLVMYIGAQTVSQAKLRGGPIFLPTDPGVGVMAFLLTSIDSEGQYHLLNSMMMHLRYPNAHTHWFSCFLLHIFVDIKDERFGEILTRVFFERFIANRPHPWGVCMTFIQLLRNPIYDFWSRDFVRVSPEITALLESIANSLFSQP